MCDAMLARVVALSLCLSVRPSVCLCLSHSGIVSVGLLAPALFIHIDSSEAIRVNVSSICYRIDSKLSDEMAHHY